MALYMIQYDSDAQGVEAPSFAEAIIVWRRALIKEWQDDDCYKDNDEVGLDPEQVTLICDRPVLR